MSEPFLSEIKIFGFNFPPRGWAQCDGQILPINQNQSLYSLLGTTYGGDGRTTFGLPDLRGRAALHEGSGYTQGEDDGVATVGLTLQDIPQHQHALQGSANNAMPNAPPMNNVLARSTTPIYQTADNLVEMNAMAVGNSGSGQAHENMQPYLAMNFCIALQGLFPSRN